jgi:hypothetical protein
MKVETTKIGCGGKYEWLITVDNKTIGIAFTKTDAKYIAKCIRKYKKSRRKS